MDIFSTEQMPEGIKIKTLFPMILTVGKVQVSQKGLLKKILDKDKNEAQEIIDQLIDIAPTEANAIIGVKVSTSIAVYKEGTFLHITYIGTPAIIS